MTDEMFNELVASMQETVAIHCGERFCRINSNELRESSPDYFLCYQKIKLFRR